MREGGARSVAWLSARETGLRTGRGGRAEGEYPTTEGDEVPFEEGVVLPTKGRTDERWRWRKNERVRRW